MEPNMRQNHTPAVTTNAPDRLRAEVPEACRRGGVSATLRECSARVAKRVGTVQAEVTRRMRTPTPPPRRVSALASCNNQPLDPIPSLAATILGTREREVFLARRDARPHDIAALHRLASRLAISVDRVYQLEASARRKLAKAIG
jgi:hypothetical protein